MIDKTDNENDAVYLFKERCTLSEFIEWFYDNFASIFTQNTLKLRTIAGDIVYTEAYKLYPNKIVSLVPEERKVVLLDDNEQILGELFIQDIDLYLLCSVSTNEYGMALELMYDDYRVDY